MRSIFGFPVKIHYSLLILMGVHVISNWDHPNKIIIFLFNILVVFGSVFFHELGHIYVAKALGYQTKSLTFSFLGGAAEIDCDFYQKPKVEFWVTVAGPMVNVLFALISYQFLDTWDFKLSTIEVLTGESMLQMFFASNVLLFLFNILPMYPMDGGRVMRSGLSLLSGKTSWSTKFTNWFSIGFGTLMVIGFIYIGMYMAAVISLLVVIANAASIYIKKDMLGGEK